MNCKHLLDHKYVCATNFRSPRFEYSFWENRHDEHRFTARFRTDTSQISLQLMFKFGMRCGLHPFISPELLATPLPRPVLPATPLPRPNLNRCTDCYLRILAECYLRILLESSL